MQVAASIIEGYIVFGGTEFLNRHASDVARLLDLVVDNVSDKGLLSILPVIDILIQVPDANMLPLVFFSNQDIGYQVLKLWYVYFC